MAGRTDAFLVSTGVDFALARYNPDGTLDGTFGSGGLVTTDFSRGPIVVRGASDQAFSVAIQADGRIVVAGSGGTDGDFALARYNPDGSLDLSFDGDGRVTTDFGAGSFDVASVVAIQEDGKIVASCFSYSTFRDGDFALARYHPD